MGTADDLVDADGEAVLDWKQALEAALDWFKKVEKPGYLNAAELTVQTAVDEYSSMRDARDSARAGRPVRSDGRSRLTRYVKVDEKLAGTCLCDLTESDLKAWQDRIQGLKILTRQRLANDLKAALNYCHQNHRRSLPSDFPMTVKYGLKPEERYWEHGETRARDNQILEDQQVRKIIRLARELDEDGDFALVVILLAATGARFSQLRRMTVGDVQLDHSRLLVPTSFKGKGRSPDLIKVPVGEDVLGTLRPAIVGRKASEPLLQRWRYKQVNAIKWVRNSRGPWKTASEMTRDWRCVVAAAGLEGVIPYALRHSSIVRGIRANLPIRLVAAVHDTSVTMIERHYSRWITEGLEEMAARAIVPLLAA
ncbi:tyrosine-type recombinase/integrase [Sphingomonas sp. URHD0057]|uniref:tyrosine-type recombinase/integrase n=1 Tax=Sphingomonas sp. URHD0057 TaxID=1380389 RepID=UPI0018CC5284|nr:tyrosine-type recombinase/integrase [Sphingomonas sp. URHD0057]